MRTATRRDAGLLDVLRGRLWRTVGIVGAVMVVTAGSWGRYFGGVAAYVVRLRCKLNVHCKCVKRSGGPDDVAADRCSPAGAAEPGAGAARGPGPCGRAGDRVADDAKARAGRRRRGDVAVQPRREQGGPARR